MLGAGETAEKKKREAKAAKTKVKTADAVSKVTPKSQKSAIKRRRRDLLKKGMKYEVCLLTVNVHKKNLLVMPQGLTMQDIVKEEEQMFAKEMDVDKE